MADWSSKMPTIIKDIIDEINLKVSELKSGVSEIS